MIEVDGLGADYTDRLCSRIMFPVEILFFFSPWCNGNTPVFGTGIPGSNPGGLV